MRPRVGNTRGGKRLHNRDGSEAQNGDGENQYGQHGHFYVVGFDFLSQIFGSPTDHQTGYEHSKNHKHNDAVEASANSAENHFAEHDVNERHHAAQWSEGVVL